MNEKKKYISEDFEQQDLSLLESNFKNKSKKKKKLNDSKKYKLAESMDNIFAHSTIDTASYSQSSRIEIVERLNNYQRIFTESNKINKYPTIRNSIRDKQFNSERFLEEQRLKIRIMKEELSTIDKKITEDQIKAIHEKKISLSNTKNKWKYTTFTTNSNQNCKEIPKINNKEWNYTKNISLPLEIRNLIFRSEYTFDYYLCNCEINCVVILQGISTFWIFLHSEANIENENTAVIQLSKTEENNQKLFLSLGVFVNKDDYKIFTRQQLINFNNKAINNKIFTENDTCCIKLIIYDPGDNNIKIKAFVNNCLFENSIESDIFLPVNNKSNIFISGSGERCTIKEFSIMTFAKEKYILKYNLKYISQDASTGNDCACCSIF